jgi:hypothetical protein
MASLIKTARIGGILYLIIVVTGIFAEIFVRSKLIVSGDATATANNIMASELRFRMGFVSALIMLVCDVVVTLILYVLLKPISKNIALLAAFFRLVSIAVMGINLLHHLAALFPLGDKDYLKVFEPQQLHTLAYLSLKSYDYGYNISLVFFGFHCLLLGYLLFRSSYFSRTLGVLLVISGLCYLTNSFSWFIVPTFATKIYPVILLPCFVGELSLSFWLLVKGIKQNSATRAET